MRETAYLIIYSTVVHTDKRESFKVFNTSEKN